MRRKELFENMRKRWHTSQIYLISALTRDGVDTLVDSIMARFSHRIQFELVLPQTGGTESLLTWLRQKTSISRLEYANDVRIVGACDEGDVKRIHKAVTDLKGKMTLDDAN
jgi:50S ribosomal subunit-associated GTPase HflX